MVHFQHIVRLHALPSSWRWSITPKGHAWMQSGGARRLIPPPGEGHRPPLGWGVGASGLRLLSARAGPGAVVGVPMSVFEINQSRTEPLSPCAVPHVPTSPPRLLCQVPDPADPVRAILSCHVSTCPAAEPDLGDAALLLFEGDLCDDEVGRIREIVRDYVRFAGAVVLDVSHVRALDSVGVRFIESLRLAQRRPSTTFAVHDPSLIAERVLQICDVHDVVTLCRPPRQGPDHSPTRTPDVR